MQVKLIELGDQLKGDRKNPTLLFPIRMCVSVCIHVHIYIYIICIFGNICNLKLVILTYAILCNLIYARGMQHYLGLEYFQHFKGKPSTHKQSLPIFTSPGP